MEMKELGNLTPINKKRRPKPQAEQEKLPPVSKPEPLENKYASKPKVGSEKSVSRPGTKVTEIGLGGLKTTTY
jgi:hypothetical protein